MNGWRLFFFLAGLFNIAGGVMGFLGVEGSFQRRGLPPPTYPFAFQLLFLAVITLGVGYWMVAYDPLRNRGLVWIGLLTKLEGAAMTYWAMAQGQLPTAGWWQPLINDVGWAIGFVIFLVRSRRTAGR